MLKSILTAPIESNWGDRYGGNRPYWFQDHNSLVLGVAHLDTVMALAPIKRKSIIYAPQLDDRLGVWCLLHGLPMRGIKIDILLTTDEEHMNSTAQDFIPNKQYNWVIEFDRAGTDIVTYQYTDFNETLHNAGFRVNRGSYSDICELEHLNCLCANIGIGYHNQHTINCYADLRDTNAQLDHFAEFYWRNRATHFEYNPDYNLDTEYQDIIGNNYCDYSHQYARCDLCGDWIQERELICCNKMCVCNNCIGEVSYV